MVHHRSCKCRVRGVLLSGIHIFGGGEALFRLEVRCGRTRGESVNLHHSHGVVVKDSGHIFRRELVGCVGDEQAGLSYSTVPHHDTPRRSGLVPEKGVVGREGGERVLDSSNNHSEQQQR